MPAMPDGWYPHEPGDPFYELDWLFLHEHPVDPQASLGVGAAGGARLMGATFSCDIAYLLQRLGAVATINPPC